MTSPAPRPETVEKLASAVYPSFAMLAGMQLDLFTPLKDGPMRAEQLAAALGVRADKLQPLLYALVAAELLTVKDDRFSNTPEADHFLVRGKLTYRGGRHERLLPQWLGVLKTAETIRTGLPQDKHDFSTMSEEGLRSLYRGNHAEAVAAGRDLAARYDFTVYRNLLDVGGGTGALAIALTGACPQLRATVVDLPTVTPITQRYVAEAGATDRIQVVAADVVSDPVKGSFDVTILRSLIQVLSPDQARRALKNVSQVIKPGGAIYILGAILDDSRLSPPEIVLLNINFLNIYDEGQAYTGREYRDWITEAGFVDFKRVILPNERSIVTARKPGERSR
jgi:ubiquinone/menaquinone biosynthesis C-methylase UbiE